MSILDSRPNWMKISADPAVKKVAEELCFQHHHNRETATRLEPGTRPFPGDTECIDGELGGLPAFFRWRQFVPFAYQLVQIVRSQ